jgi:very-short-patch-repair endonuclease
MRRLTQEGFIEKCNEVHDNKYDYSLVEYKGVGNKIEIICHKHGIFTQGAKQHKEGQGCSKCSGKYKKTTKEFIKESKKIHGDKYDYSLVEYINNRTLVKLIDREYGYIFEQRPEHHLNGFFYNGYTTESFILKSKEIHGDKYDYSLVEYINSKTPVTIIDREYGFTFNQNPQHHLNGHGSSGKITKDHFIKKCSEIHNNRYDYSLINEILSNKNKVKIICKEHGEFKQSVSNHMNLKQDCPKCAGNFPYTTESFTKRCDEIHNGKYDYSLVDYKGIGEKIKIICNDHGIFKQSASKHLNSEQGCPECKTISRGENKISKILNKNNIEYIKEHSFEDCKNINKLPFDFYIPSKNIIIEYDGIQHFKSVDFFGGEKELKHRQKLDKIKDKYCEKNNIYLIRIPYTEYKNVERILEKII